LWANTVRPYPLKSQIRRISHNAPLSSILRVPDVRPARQLRSFDAAPPLLRRVTGDRARQNSVTGVQGEHRGPSVKWLIGNTLKIRGRGHGKDFPSHLLSRGYASSVADRGYSTKPSWAVRHTTPARSVSTRYLARRSRARVMLEPRASSQISKNSTYRQNRSIFETVDIRAEDTDVFVRGDTFTALFRNICPIPAPLVLRRRDTCPATPRRELLTVRVTTAPTLRPPYARSFRRCFAPPSVIIMVRLL
jgi:hypothetical protein